MRKALILLIIAIAVSSSIEYASARDVCPRIGGRTYVNDARYNIECPRGTPRLKVPKPRKHITSFSEKKLSCCLEMGKDRLPTGDSLPEQTERSLWGLYCAYGYSTGQQYDVDTCLQHMALSCGADPSRGGGGTIGPGENAAKVYACFVARAYYCLIGWGDLDHDMQASSQGQCPSARDTL